MFFRKAFCIVVILVFLSVSCLWSSSLLSRSLENAQLDELKAMAVAFGLDTNGDEDAIRSRILDYFEISDTNDDAAGNTNVSIDSNYSEKTGVTISIEHSDSMFVLDNIVALSGNVKLSFSNKDSSKKVLSANKVVVDLDLKAIEASGDVVLDDTEAGARNFTGKSVYFDWSNLDVIVFEGISSTERKNAAGTKISLYASGNSISYDGEQNIVFFKDGVISTAQRDPYWSITASKVSFAGLDVFIDGATFRLGRVPIMYFPFFFYPGTKLAFNPAIGLSSDKGAFLNTTTELYGVYSKASSTSSTSSTSSSSDLSDSLLSMLDSGDSSEKIRDGIIYRNLEEGEELSNLESWARKSGSYFAFFADTYEDMGLVAGYDTSNKFFDNAFSFSSVGAVGYNPNESSFANKTRYYLDLNLGLKLKNISLSLSMPIFSDYYVKRDFLNRNTLFGLDSVFGANQTFPSTYSYQKEYSWTASANASGKIGSINLNLTSLSAQVDFDFDVNSSSGKYTYTPKIKSATLPEISFSSNASWVIAKFGSSDSSNSKDSSNFSDVYYENDTARAFHEEFVRLQEEQELEQDLEKDLDKDLEEDLEQNEENFEEFSDDVSEDVSENISEDVSAKSSSLNLQFYKGPSSSSSAAKSSTEGSITVGYTFNQNFNNKYTTELVPSSLYSKTSGTFYLNGSAPNSWFSIKETIKPQYTFTSNITKKSDESLSYKNVNDVTLVSSLVAESQVLGITYKLSNKIYSANKKDVDGTVSESSSAWGEWKKSDVTEHSLELKKKLGSFTFSFTSTLKPVKQTLKPAIVFSKNSFTASANISFNESDTGFTTGIGNLSLSYTTSMFSLSITNAYDFTKYDKDNFFAAYSFTQNGSLKFFNGKLSISESVKYKENLLPSSMNFGFSHSWELGKLSSNYSSSLSFTGNNKEWDLDVLRMKFNNKLEPIYFWKGRIGLELASNISFVYSFSNPYATSFSVDFSAEFAIAQFLSLKFAVSSSNKSFYKYFVDGVFSFDAMFEDLIKSFDFFGNGRKSTGFNMSSFYVELIHYMKDWDFCCSIEGKLVAQSNGKLVWAPVYKAYIKWNAIPELKVEKTVDTSTEE